MSLMSALIKLLLNWSINLFKKKNTMTIFGQASLRLFDKQKSKLYKGF